MKQVKPERKNFACRGVPPIMRQTLSRRPTWSSSESSHPPLAANFKNAAMQQGHILSGFFTYFLVTQETTLRKKHNCLKNIKYI